MFDSAVPASIGDRLPRNVCTPTWNALPLDQFRTVSMLSSRPTTGTSAICCLISETLYSCVQ